MTLARFLLARLYVDSLKDKYTMREVKDTLRISTDLTVVYDSAIKRISEQNVVIEENYTDIFGERKLREMVLELHPQKEGADEK